MLIKVKGVHNNPLFQSIRFKVLLLVLWLLSGAIYPRPACRRGAIALASISDRHKTALEVYG